MRKYKKKYVVRWTIKPNRRGWVEAVAEEEVVFIKALETDEWGYATPFVRTAVSEQTGFIPPHFLKGFSTHSDISTKTWTNTRTATNSSQTNTNNTTSERNGSVTWYVGEVGPLQAAKYLTETDLLVGTFVVCQPPEFRNYRKHPELLLLIRIYSGSVEKWHRGWEQHSERKRKTNVGAKALIARKDTLPGCQAPLPAVAYVRIRRDQDNGDYYLFQEDGQFITVHELLTAYTKRAKGIKLDIGVDVQLQMPLPSNHKNEGPRPPYFRHQARRQKEVVSGTAKAVPSDCTLKLIGATQTQGYFGSTKIAGITYRKGKKEATELKVAVKMIDVDPAEYQRYFSALLDRRGDAIQGNYIHKWRFIANGSMLKQPKNDPVRTGLCSDFADLGSLQDYLRRNKLVLRRLLEVLYQVASGMAYLENVRLCHLALGARNILVTDVTREAVHVAVSDFYLPGLRLVKDKAFIRRRQQMDRHAWRWMAPESLCEGTFGIETDVWSYGVLAFEVLTHCTQSSLYGAHIGCPLSLLSFLDSGKRMPLPDTIPSYMQSVINDCWEQDPALRPSFHQLMKLFADLLFDSVNGPSRAIWLYEQQHKVSQASHKTLDSTANSTYVPRRDKDQQMGPMVGGRRPMRPDDCRKEKTAPRQ